MKKYAVLPTDWDTYDTLEELKANRKEGLTSGQVIVEIKEAKAFKVDFYSVSQRPTWPSSVGVHSATIGLMKSVTYTTQEEAVAEALAWSEVPYKYYITYEVPVE